LRRRYRFHSSLDSLTYTGMAEGTRRAATSMLPRVDLAISSVGSRLSALRRGRGVTLSDLARESGYTTGYLSQVESGTTVPSISALADVAAALESDLTAFFPREREPKVHVSRAGDPEKLRVAPNAREEYVVLTGRGPESAFTALIHRIYPAREVVRYRHPGERFALVLDGSLRATIDGVPHELEPGDTIHYSSHPEHEFEVTSNGPAELLWFVSPAIL
jgi:transcriptional regulator with XRE-family HTH domain